MFKKIIAWLAGLFSFVSCGWSNGSIMQAKSPAQGSVHRFSMATIDGKTRSLETYKGKILLIVNVASKCGLTPQYKDLEALYQEKKDKGLEILGFPANNFMGQEPGSNKQIQQFCQLNYGVTFPMFAKISVAGKDMHPLYRYLTSKKENGIMDAPVRWNFQKFLLDRQGRLVAVIGPARRVTDSRVQKLLATYLDKPGLSNTP